MELADLKNAERHTGDRHGAVTEGGGWMGAVARWPARALCLAASRAAPALRRSIACLVASPASASLLRRTLHRAASCARPVPQRLGACHACSPDLPVPGVSAPG